MTGFKSSVDIANRALQHCGASKIVTLADDDKGANEIASCYDGLRRAELRRNVWRFAVREAVLYPINIAATIDNTSVAPTLLLVPALYSSVTNYNLGAIVQDATGAIWVSQINNNVGNVPGAQGGQAWDTYFGSMTVNPFNTTGTTNYYTGDLVYETDGIGHNQVFLSLQSQNSSDPSDGGAWSALLSYTEGQVTQDAQGYFWISLINGNLGNMPGVYGAWTSTANYTAGEFVIGTDMVLYEALQSSLDVNPTDGSNPTYWEAMGYPGSWPVWDANTPYSNNDIIAGQDGLLYQSVQNGNTGHQPVGSTYNPITPSSNWWLPLNKYNPWVAAFVGSTTGSSSWLNLGATLSAIPINYPIYAGPTFQAHNYNVFMLPNGFLREAPQDPKAGSVSFLGAPTGRMYDDWLLQGNYLLSRTPFPIIYRFVADITRVDTMDDMFCEGLGCRIGVEICEPLTQSDAKIKTIEGKYKQFMGDARTINGIEEGPVEPPEDDYVTCRI